MNKGKISKKFHKKRDIREERTSARFFIDRLRVFLLFEQ